VWLFFIGVLDWGMSIIVKKSGDLGMFNGGGRIAAMVIRFALSSYVFKGEMKIIGKNSFLFSCDECVPALG